MRLRPVFCVILHQPTFMYEPCPVCSGLCVSVIPSMCVCVCERVSVGLVAGEVLLERGEEVPDDGHAPGAAQQPLPGQATHVGHVGVVDGETKHPADTQDTDEAGSIGSAAADRSVVCQVVSQVPLLCLKVCIKRKHTFPSLYTTGCPLCCPCRRGNAHLSPASQSWSVSLSYATSQTGISIQRQTHTHRRRQTNKHTHPF